MTLARRREQILLLLGSRFDGLYVSAPSLLTQSGVAPNRIETCKTCGGIEIRDDLQAVNDHEGEVLVRRKGRGYVKDRFGREMQCADCGGSGYIARDPMVNNVRVGSEATTATARPRHRKTCDRCAGSGVWKGERCALCDGDGKRDLHVFELQLDTRDVDERDPMLTAIERRNQAGSYHELEHALVAIQRHVNKPPRYQWLTDNATAAVRLLDELYLPPATRHEGQLTPGERALVDLAIGYIDERMPATIRVPAAVQANRRELEQRRTRAKGRASDPRAHERRDQELRDHARAGRSPQWIAAEYGLSVRQVYDVLKRRAS